MPIRDARTNLIIFPERDATLTPFARKLLEDFYLRPGETPQEGYARAAKAWSGGKDDLAQRLYEAVSKGWFMFASPVLGNAPLPGEKVRGLPISCFLTHVSDTLEGLIEHTAEARWLSVLGGGVGGLGVEILVDSIDDLGGDLRGRCEGECQESECQGGKKRVWEFRDHLLGPYFEFTERDMLGRSLWRRSHR